MSESRRLRVEVPGAAYDVVVGRGVLGEIGVLLASLGSRKQVALVTDDTVARLLGHQVDAALARAGFSVTSLTVPAGESSKSWPMAGEIVEALASAGLGRDSALVALGGGVVGDLAGFAAAVYLRGIDFVQVPTTLLAMVDSSVGGKTAVDLAAGKNLAGAFKQPLAVVADVDVLDTLPDAEWRSGLAEVAKTAVLDGEAFVGWLEANLTTLRTTSAEETVERCVACKASVVASDEKEEGLRECLNYGHTLGHAIEKVLGYGSVTHGEAVAEGMRFAARVAMDVSAASPEFVKRQDRLLDALGLRSLEIVLPAEALLAAMHSDKKTRQGAIRMVLADGPGRWHCGRVDDAVVLAHLHAWADTKRKEPQ